MSDVLRVERDRTPHVETWTLDLPDQRNPISGHDVVAALVENLERVDADTDVRAWSSPVRGRRSPPAATSRDMEERRGMFGGTPWELRNGYRHGIQRIPRGDATAARSRSSPRSTARPSAPGATWP